MSSYREFSSDEAKIVGEKIGIDFQKVDLDEFRVGLTVELEHGSHDPETNVINDDEMLAGKIAWAHLKEIRDYYSRLAVMEKEGEAYWASQE